MKTFIYILIDPRDNQVKYVGKTNNVKRRYSQHISLASKNKTYKTNWLSSLIIMNLKPEMVVIDECEDDSWIELEQWYIELFKSWGFKLTNLTKGGDGVRGFKPSKESLLKRSIAQKGKKLSKETKIKIGNANRGKNIQMN